MIINYIHYIMWDVCLCLDQGYREQYCYLLLLLSWHKKYNRSTTKLNLRKKKSKGDYRFRTVIVAISRM